MQRDPHILDTFVHNVFIINVPNVGVIQVSITGLIGLQFVKKTIKISLFYIVLLIPGLGNFFIFIL
jgi:hypothetical protein